MLPKPSDPRRFAGTTSRPSGPRFPAWKVALPAAGLLASLLVIVSPLRAGGAGGAARQGAPAGMCVPPMTAAAMKAAAAAYWARHARVGTEPAAARTGLSATFTVSGFSFDNGSPSAIDTARISVGESVTWIWESGFHTITSGDGSGDPQAGALFDQPSDPGNTEFSFTFQNAGTFPFFCQFHEGLGMRGVVVVSDLTGVGPTPGGMSLGFTRDPAPNPTRMGVRFEYGLARPGRVLAEVFDAGGRRVASLVDAELSAGPHSAEWSGLGTTGRVRTGVYYIRLRLPGYEQSRRIVVRH